MRGMTLIELLVSISVVALVMTAAAESTLALHRVNANSTTEIVQVASARSGFSDLITDLRQASYGSDGSYPIQTMGHYGITFFSDISSSIFSEKISYQLNDAVLTRISTPPGTPPTYSGTPVSIT